MKRHIPNILTLCNAFSGCIGIACVMNKQLELAGIMVFVGAFFDFFDGMVARLLKVSSELGQQLDSLSDAITFGVLPSFIVLHFLEVSGVQPPFSYIAFLIVILSVLRLAIFNLDNSQKNSFKGLPTPAHAIFWASIPLVQYQLPLFISSHLAYWLIGFTLVMSTLLVFPVRLFSLKLKNFSWAQYRNQYVFLILSAGLLVGFKLLAIPLIIIVYIIWSVLFFKES